MTSFVLVERWRGVLGFRLRPESFITSSVLAKQYPSAVGRLFKIVRNVMLRS